MLVYHGTSERFALELATDPRQVSVERGGGELGQGFYVGDHAALAAAWAWGRHKRQAAVLEIGVPTAMYVVLEIKVLNGAQVMNIWNQLKASNKHRSYRFGVDVVHGPLATLQHATQHKFESLGAEEVLRSSVWRKL